MKNKPQYFIAMGVAFFVCGTLLRFGGRHPRIIIPLMILTVIVVFWISGYWREWWSLRPRALAKVDA